MTVSQHDLPLQGRGNVKQWRLQEGVWVQVWALHIPSITSSTAAGELCVHCMPVNASLPAVALC